MKTTFTVCFLISVLVIFIVGCVATVPGDGPDPFAHPFGEHIPAKVKAFQELGAKVSPLLGKYYLANTSKCKFPYNDNEVEIEGFTWFAAQHGIHLKGGLIVDPWGDQVHLVIGREGDGKIYARGESYIGGSSPGEILTGILLNKPSRVDGLGFGPGLEWMVLPYQIK
jgi:hypothetical protein